MLVHEIVLQGPWQNATVLWSQFEDGALRLHWFMEISAIAHGLVLGTISQSILLEQPWCVKIDFDDTSWLTVMWCLWMLPLVDVAFCMVHVCAQERWERMQWLFYNYYHYLWDTSYSHMVLVHNVVICFQELKSTKLAANSRALNQLQNVRALNQLQNSRALH